MALQASLKARKIPAVIGCLSLKPAAYRYNGLILFIIIKYFFLFSVFLSLLKYNEVPVVTDCYQ